jgi:hypothetical protein
MLANAIGLSKSNTIVIWQRDFGLFPPRLALYDLAWRRPLNFKQIDTGFATVQTILSNELMLYTSLAGLGSGFGFC